MELSHNLVAKDKFGLLSAMMQALAGDRSRIAFEGRGLLKTALSGIAGATTEETAILKRATIAPRLDFMILPMNKETIPQLEAAIHYKIGFGERGIIHVQIEADGRMAFAAYDSFHPQTVVAFSPVRSVLLDELVAKHVIRSYHSVSPKR